MTNLLNMAHMIEHEDMMLELDEMLEAYKENGGVVREFNDLDIRRMVIRRKYLTQEKDNLKQMKDAVVDQWNQRIKSKESQIDQINDIIFNYTIQRGGSLVLDVGTISTRTNKHKVEITDLESLASIIETREDKEQFMKAPAYDETAIKNYFVGLLDSSIEDIETIRKSKLDELDAKYNDEVKEIKKPADKKVIQAKYADLKKEIHKEHDAIIEKTIEDFKKWIPDCVSYVPSSKSLSIRMT